MDRREALKALGAGSLVGVGLAAAGSAAPANAAGLNWSVAGPRFGQEVSPFSVRRAFDCSWAINGVSLSGNTYRNGIYNVPVTVQAHYWAIYKVRVTLRIGDSWKRHQYMYRNGTGKFNFPVGFTIPGSGTGYSHSIELYVKAYTGLRRDVSNSGRVHFGHLP